MQKYHSKHENIAKQTQFRTWKKGKSWLYAASILTVLTGGAAASSVVTPDTVTASADTVTPAAYRPAGEATGPGSVVSSEVAANASSYYAAASSALSGTDSDGVHSSGASDIVSSANDKAADANSYISSSTGSLSSGASSVASGTLDDWNNAASSFVSAASSNTTTNSLSSAVSNYQNALDSANSYNVANNIKTSGGANSEYAATYSDGSGNTYSSNAVSQYQSAVDSYSTAVHNYYNSAVATLDKNATLSGWYDTLTADKNILNAYDSDSAANTPAGALKSDSSAFATALSGLNSLVSASGASNFFSSAAASVAAAGSDVATYDYSSAYSLAVVRLQTTANQVLTQYQTDYGTYITAAEQYAQDSNTAKAAGYNGTVTALTDSATQQINFDTAWGNASQTIKDFTTSANTNGTLMNDNAQIMADYEVASLAYTDFSNAATQQNTDLVTLTDIVTNFPMSASTSGETTATDTLTSWESQYTAAIHALQSDVAKTEYYQGIYNDKLAAYNDDATDPLYPSDNPTLPTATGNTAADYLNKIQTGLGTIDAAQNGTVSADAAQVLTNYETDFTKYNQDFQTYLTALATYQSDYETAYTNAMQNNQAAPALPTPPTAPNLADYFNGTVTGTTAITGDIPTAAVTYLTNQLQQDQYNLVSASYDQLQTDINALIHTINDFKATNAPSYAQITSILNTYNGLTELSLDNIKDLLSLPTLCDSLSSAIAQLIAAEPALIKTVQADLGAYLSSATIYNTYNGWDGSTGLTTTPYLTWNIKNPLYTLNQALRQYGVNNFSGQTPNGGVLNNLSALDTIYSSLYNSNNVPGAWAITENYSGLASGYQDWLLAEINAANPGLNATTLLDPDLWNDFYAVNGFANPNAPTQAGVVQNPVPLTPLTPPDLNTGYTGTTSDEMTTNAPTQPNTPAYKTPNLAASLVLCETVTVTPPIYGTLQAPPTAPNLMLNAVYPPAVTTLPTAPEAPTSPTLGTLLPAPSVPSLNLPTPPTMPSLTIPSVPTPPSLSLPAIPIPPALDLPTDANAPKLTLPTAPTPPTPPVLGQLPEVPTAPSLDLPTPPTPPTISLPSAPTPPTLTNPNVTIPALPALPSFTPVDDMPAPSKAVTNGSTSINGQTTDPSILWDWIISQQTNGAPTTYSDFENYVAAVSAWKEQVAQVISVYQKQVADADGAYDADTAAIATYLTAYQTYSENYDTAVSGYNTAWTTYDSAYQIYESSYDAAVTKYQSEFNDYKQAQSDYESQYESVVSAYQSAWSAYVSAYGDYQNAYEKAVSDYTTAWATYVSAHNDYAGKYDAEVSAYTSAWTQYLTQFSQYSEDYDTAVSQYESDWTNYDTDYQTYKTGYDSAVSNYNNDWNTYDVAYQAYTIDYATAVGNYNSTWTKYLSDYSTYSSTYDSVTGTYEGDWTAYDATYQTYKTAWKAYDSAYQQLVTDSYDMTDFTETPLVAEETKTTYADKVTQETKETPAAMSDEATKADIPTLSDEAAKDSIADKTTEAEKANIPEKSTLAEEATIPDKEDKASEATIEPMTDGPSADLSADSSLVPEAIKESLADKDAEQTLTQGDRPIVQEIAVPDTPDTDAGDYLYTSDIILDTFDTTQIILPTDVSQITVHDKYGNLVSPDQYTVTITDVDATHKLVTITFASSFVLSDRFYNNTLTVSIPTHSTWAIAGLGPDYDNTAYTITTSPKGKTKQPTNTVHVRPVLPNTPPTVPPVAPPETPNIPEKPNLPNSPRIPQVPKVPNQPMIPRKPTLSLTSSRLKIPEPLKYVPVGKILPHTGDNSDSSLTIYGGAALIGFIGLEIYSLKRRKKSTVKKS